MKTFKIDESNNRVKRETFNSPRIINLGELAKNSNIDDALAEQIFWPVAEKHGIVDAALDKMHPVEILAMSEMASPSDRLDFMLNCASLEDD